MNLTDVDVTDFGNNGRCPLRPMTVFTVFTLLYCVSCLVHSIVYISVVLLLQVLGTCVTLFNGA